MWQEHGVQQTEGERSDVAAFLPLKGLAGVPGGGGLSNGMGGVPGPSFQEAWACVWGAPLCPLLHFGLSARWLLSGIRTGKSSESGIQGIYLPGCLSSLLVFDSQVLYWVGGG